MSDHLRIIKSRFTPRNDANESTDRTCAKLLIYPGEIPPAEITDLIGVVPTRTVTKGVVHFLGRQKRPVIGKKNFWCLSSEEQVESKDLRSHLDWMIEKLEPHASVITEIQAKSNVRMYVSCIWWSKHGGGGPTLWPEQMRDLANLNLECTFSFAFYSDD